MIGKDLFCQDKRMHENNERIIYDNLIILVTLKRRDRRTIIQQLYRKKATLKGIKLIPILAYNFHIADGEEYNYRDDFLKEVKK